MGEELESRRLFGGLYGNIPRGHGSLGQGEPVEITFVPQNERGYRPQVGRCPRRPRPYSVDIGENDHVPRLPSVSVSVCTWA